MDTVCVVELLNEKGETASVKVYSTERVARKETSTLLSITMSHSGRKVWDSKTGTARFTVCKVNEDV